ncbi:MAG: hypothetical protein JNL36_06610 [Candidatus Kapabacteria bacterium]|nr:hypothetical protein [Candidatus Kapabacteria bacterium]
MKPTEFLQQTSTVSQAFAQMNEKMATVLKNSLQQQQQQIATNYDAYLKMQQQFYASEENASQNRNNRRKTEVQTFVQSMGSALQTSLKQQEKQLLSLSSTSEKIVASLGTSLVSTMAGVLAEGKSFVESTSKILVGTALQALDALVPVIVAQITGVQLASPNPANALSFGSAGLASAIALTATFKGLVALAKSAAGFKEGGLVRGGEQFIRINELGQEFVMNAQSTKAFLPELQQLNAGKIPQSFTNTPSQTPPVLLEKMEQLIDKLHSRTTSVHNTITVSGTLRATGNELQTIIDKQLRRKVVLS